MYTPPVYGESIKYISSKREKAINKTGEMGVMLCYIVLHIYVVYDVDDNEDDKGMVIVHI